MKLTWATYNFFPERFGGTEVYAAAAARALRSLGHSVSFIAGTTQRLQVVRPPLAAATTQRLQVVRPPLAAATTQRLQVVRPPLAAAAAEEARFGAVRFETRETTYDGMPVTFLAVRSERFRWKEMLGLEAEDLTAHWREWLRRHPCDLLHLHGYSPACSVSLVLAAKQEGIPVAMSFHHPGLLCARGDFVHPWKRPCDGRVRILRCSLCFGLTKLQALKGRQPKENAACSEKTAAEAAEDRWRKLKTAASLPHQFRLKQRAWDKLVSHVDGWHAFSEETRRILLRNGVSEGRIRLIPHGVERRPPAIRDRSPLVRVGYVGRFHPEKGVRILCQAIRKIPAELPLRFLFYGRGQDEREREVQEEVAALCREDPRAAFPGGFQPGQSAQVFSGMDVLVIPSLAFETGPLVALEAFQAGVPVVGPRWGSLPSLVREGVNGLLFPWADVQALAACLKRIGTEEGLLEKLRSGVRPPPLIEEHVHSLLEFYEQLLGKARSTWPA